MIGGTSVQHFAMIAARLFILVAVKWGVCAAGPTVRLDGGWIEGETVQFTEPNFLKVNKTVDIYKNIPYTEPPTGTNRFKPPIKKEPWRGRLPCFGRFKPACMQTFPSLSGTDEDCLFIHVYAPQNLSPNAAVMVFLHGGAYVFGSGSMPEYTGYPLVSVGDVILVTVNYRLGPFGFMTTGDSVLPANAGMLDQVMALEWVRDNIENFGGDPGQVTLFGESAGASSVGLHMLSKMSSGLFQRAIMQSGVSTTTFAYRRDINEIIRETHDIATAVGCGNQTSLEMVLCMRNVSARELLLRAFEVTISFQPVVDGSFLHDYPETLLQKGDFQKVPILLGNLVDEGATYVLVVNTRSFNSKTPPYMSRDDFLEAIPRYLYEANTDAVKLALDTFYANATQLANSSADYLENFIRITTDQSWTAPADFVAKAHVRGGSTVYMYQMTHDPTVSVMDVFALGPAWLGAAHGEDIPFVFGNAWAEELFYKTKVPLDEEKQLAANVMTYWTNFAKTGDPNDGQLPTWPIYQMPAQEYKEISPELENRKMPIRQKYCHFWNEYVPKLLTMFGSREKVQADYKKELQQWKHNDMTDWKESLNTL